MVTKGLVVNLHAKKGKEQELGRFLADALPLVEREPQTIAWFAFRTGESTFAIVDTFPDEAGRTAHLQGAVAAALGSRAAELLEQPPAIDPVDVIAAKLPEPDGERAA
jgi:quinol monooxygenase YgiN